MSFVSFLARSLLQEPVWAIQLYYFVIRRAHKDMLSHDHSPGLPVAPLYYKLNDRTVLISYIIYDEGKSL